MIVAAALILDQHRNALMTRRKLEGQCPGMWEYPGGKAHADETPEQAMVREVREELGIKVRGLGLVTCSHLDFGTPFEFWLIHAEIVSGTPEPKVGQLDLQYVDQAHAVALLPCCPSSYVCYPPVREFLKRFPRPPSA